MLDLPKYLFLPLLGAAVICSPALRGCLLPFAGALLIARWADRPVSRLAGWMPRPLAAFLILSLSALLVLDALLLLGVQLWRTLPETGVVIPAGNGMFASLSRLVEKLPSPLSGAGAWAVQQLRDQSGVLHTRLETAAADLAARSVSALPRGLLTAGITLLAAFYACADWERVCRWRSLLIPPAWTKALSAGVRRLGQGAAGWLRVQGRLFLLQWAILWAGLTLLQVEGSWVRALAVALADALPLFGSGIVLLPWAALVLMQGDAGLAGGLTLLWGAAALSRSVLEPRMLGRQAGSSPLLTLLALYAGLRLWGVGGMVLSPIALHALTCATEKPAPPDNSREKPEMSQF